MKTLQFLLLEDSTLDAELIQATLQDGGIAFELRQVQTRADFVAALQSDSFDLILSDYSLPNFDGVSALALAQQYCPQVPFIFVSATLGEELAIETLKRGATDYVVKQRLGRLVPAVQRALRETQERQERQRAELALQATEDRYRSLFEQSPFGVLLIRPDDQSFVEFNSQAHRQLGYSHNEFAQLRLYQIEARESPEQIADHSQAIVQQGFDQFESQHYTKSGELRDVLITVQAITIGNQQYLHAIWQDITERKRSEKALQERNARLKLLYETTSDLLSTSQPITLLDDLFKKLSSHIDLHCYLGFLVESVDDKPLLKLAAYSGIPAIEAQTLHQLDLESTMCGLAISQNRPVILPDVQASTLPRAALIRSLGLTAYAGYPLSARGQLLGALSFGSRSRTAFTPEELDLLQVTADQVAVALERASLLDSLQQQTEQLSQANRIKDEFLAVLSHELRTPLNPILGWAKLLRTKQYDAITTARALEIIERNAKTQTQLIEDLLDVSRILRGKLSLNIAPVDLIATVQAALETVQLAAEAKAIDLRFTILDLKLNDVGEASPSTHSEEQSGQSKLFSVAAHSASQNLNLQVLGDVNRLQQVVWNLLSNAIKFTPQGGRVEVCLQSSPPHAQIIVTDTGQGINPDFLPYVFDYFRQADGSTTRVFGGLGLGLAIVRHLVELHGGTIKAASAGEGQGATFTVQLPLLQSQRSHLEPISPASMPIIPLQGIRILVVDDDKDALEYIAFLLEQSGALVLATMSATDALETLRQAKPDLLISDIGMPNQDGYMLLHQVRQLPSDQGGQIPAIALTAYARDEDCHQALSAGFQTHLAKPIEPDRLIATVTQLVKAETSIQKNCPELKTD